MSVSLASRHPSKVHGVILENTFLSISAMVDKIMPFFIRIFKPLVLRIKWNSDEAIPQLQCPILFISGDSDELVPPQHMKQLHDLAVNSQHKDFYTVFGGQHNDTWEKGGKDYYEVSCHLH